MKILLLNDHIKPVGGAEVLASSFCRQLRAQGHEVRILASNAHGTTAGADYACFGSRAFYTPLVQAANWSARARLRAVLAEFQPDVVHVQMFLTQLSPLILPLLKKLPTVYYAVWYRALCPVGTKLLPGGQVCTKRWGNACLRHRCLPAHDWAVLSAQLTLVDRWKGAFDKIAVPTADVQRTFLANGFPVDAIIAHGRPERPRPRVERSPVPTVAFCGRLVRPKGADVLLRAFRRVRQILPEAQLLLIGDGPERSALEKQARAADLTDHVNFRGHLPFADCEAELATAWVQVVPSVWQEPFGLVIIDAMLRGTPLVASNLGGPRAILTSGKNGLLVPPNDPVALADSLLELLQNPDVGHRLSGEAQQMAQQRLSIEAFTNAFVSLYQKMVN